MGWYFDGLGEKRPLIERTRLGIWNFEVAGRPEGATGGELTGVSCSSASDCTAVGSFSRRDGSSLSLVEHWTGRPEWTVQNPHGMFRGAVRSLAAVSCASASVCMAIGSAGDGARIMAGRKNGQRWTTQPVLDLLGPESGQLTGVSCTSASSCTAVGEVNTSYRTTAGGVSRERPLAEVWNGAQWTPETLGVRHMQLAPTSALCPAPRRRGAQPSGATATQAASRPS